MRGVKPALRLAFFRTARRPLPGVRVTSGRSRSRSRVMLAASEGMVGAHRDDERL
jgi:hypothetical protein